MNQIKQDRRISKTKQAINEAMMGLMLEKPYNKITVQDIIDRANVGRATFYSHFETKDEVLFQSIGHLMEMINLELPEHESRMEPAGNGRNGRIIAVQELFSHIKENSKLLKALIKADIVNLFFDKAMLFWNEKLEEKIKKIYPTSISPNVPIPILCNFISSTLVSLLKWWFANKMQPSPAQMDDYFHQLVVPSIKACLGLSEQNL